MNVQLLPSDVISKIAAGEVIERPASVVKELVENSIDAGATSIEVYLKDAGKKSILIKDNGHGIARADLDQIFTRHATSKIKNAQDLYEIMSLGFRGEALYSIGSIADVILRSKTKDQAEAWELHIRGGQRISLKPCSLPAAGTEIEVRELFFNTPARKKFLKTDTTEVYQTLNTFLPYTLLHKNIRFVFSHQDKVLLDLSPTAHLLERIALALNLEKKHLIEAQQFKNEHAQAYVAAGDINIRRNRRDLQFIFINGRPVQNKNISYHLNQIYRLVMPPEFSPFFCVYLDIAPENIDVNIHPTKREVKLKNDTAVGALLRSITEEMLMRSGEIKHVSSSKNQQSSETPQWAISRSNLIQEALDFTPALEKSLTDGHNKSNSQDYAFPRAGGLESPSLFLSEENQSHRLHNKLSHARYIGSFLNKYLLFQSEQSLLLVDQHAAQERIVFEQLIVQMQKSQVEIQPLLSPIVIKLSAQEMLIWQDVKQKLDDIGLSTRQWDKQSIAIESHPVLLKDIEKAVRDLLAGENIGHCDFDSIARRACRSSIMTGDSLSKEQVEFQRQQLINCLDPFTCPHGRPTIIELSEDFLDKQFLRTK